jgi:D-alanyl-D-alanine carboxypeptidase/D-alanyl-D-alanine-endopeptidase (penicillin-binding protein 4)
MRRLVLFLALVAVLGFPAVASALTEGQVTRTLSREIASAGASSGAYVENLSTGERVFSRRARSDRIPASVEKLWTTIGAQATLGDDGTLLTAALASRRVELDGTLDGNLYLRGGGDPTLTSTDIEGLARDLKDVGLSEITGRVVGDETAFDTRRGPPSEGFRVSVDVAPLGALMLNRGVTGKTSPYYQPDPARFAATALATELRDIGVDVRRRGASGETPPDALALGGIESVDVADLLKLQNAPSDNYIAEMLLKATGMTDDEAGTTARGAEIVRDTALELFDLTPKVVDGSGLSRGNATSPREVVDLLAQKYEDDAFVGSLAVAGVSGTLAGRLRAGATRGNCRGKTGTLSDVSNLVGYCDTRGGDTLAFAILNNRVSPYTAHGIQDRMVAAIARYSP